MDGMATARENPVTGNFRVDKESEGLIASAPALPGANAPECGSHGGARWYAVQAKPRQETTAQRQLNNQHFQAFLPMVASQRARSVELVPLFPGYLFVLFDRSRDRWRAICSTRGVKTLMGPSPENPTAMPRGAVEHLLQTASLRAIVQDITPLPIAPGSSVRIGAGPFADQSGICLWSDHRRVRLLMEILGGARELELPRSDVVV